MVVNHKDGIKAHNNQKNLEYVTHRENDEHAHRMGLTPPPPHYKGEKNPHARFTADDVRCIRRLWREGVKQTEIAKRFNCRQGTINLIITRRTWGHLEDAS